MSSPSPPNGGRPPIATAGLLGLGLALGFLLGLARGTPHRRGRVRAPPAPVAIIRTALPTPPPAWLAAPSGGHEARGAAGRRAPSRTTAATRASVAGIVLVLVIAIGDGSPVARAGQVSGGSSVDGGSDAPGVVIEALPVRARDTAVAIEAHIETVRTVREAPAAVDSGRPGGSQPATVEAPATPADAPDERRSASGMELRIPKIWLTAPIVDLGVTASGELDVPEDGATVGWYDITALPGDPGQALLGGHFDWEGSLAVFASLGVLREGDRIELHRGTAGDPLVYAVQSSASVDPDVTLTQVLTGEEGSALILITCGGVFDEQRDGYENRLLVRATLLEDSSPAPGN